MKLWVGLVFLSVGLVLAVIGYAPLMSPLATSLNLIVIGGLLIAVGTFVVLLVSAQSADTKDLDDFTPIRP